VDFFAKFFTFFNLFSNLSLASGKIFGKPTQAAFFWKRAI